MKAILQWVLRTMMKDQTGVMRTLPRKDLVDFNVMMTAERLMRNGIDPNSLKNANQVENALKMIDDRPKVQEGIKSTESAKVFNIKGEELDPNKPIVGGTQSGKKIDTDAFIRDAEIKTRLEKQNKESVAKIRQRMVNEAIDNVSPGLSGDRKVDAELVAEDLASRMGKVYDDMPTKERLKLYEEAYSGLSKKRFKGMKKPKDADDQESSYDDGPADFDPDADNETFAQGGRAGFKSGSFLFKGAKKLGKKYKGSTLEALLENPKLLGTELSYEGIMELLRMGGMMQDGGRAGFFMGGANPRGLGTLRAILNYMAKTGKEQGKFKGADLSALDMLRFSNPKALNKMLEEVQGKVNVKEGIMGTDIIKAQQQALRGQRKDLVERTLDVAKAMKADDDAFKIRLAKEAETTIIPKVKKQLMEGMGMSEEAAEKAARNMAEATSKMKPLNAPPEITEEGLLQLENILKNLETGGKKKRELNATGGRIGFKDGMTRRTFLKIFGGLVSLPIVGKVLAPLKLTRGVSKVPIIKTDDVPGKPEWFDQLVNKVIVEGDDVTKKFATGERQSIHQKTLDDGSVVRVTEDVDDGAVRVEYESKTNPYEETTQLEYKKPLPDEGAPDPKAEFSAAETGPIARSDSARLDYEKDIEEFATGNVDELVTDFSKLKEYATGKKPTMSEIVEAKKKKDQAKKLTEGDFDAEFELMEKRQGQPFYDPTPPDDFASGGIARMLGE